MSDLTPNNDQLLQNPYPDDEIDLKELFFILWNGKWLISAATVLAAIISVLAAISLPNIYTANALLAPAENSGGGLSGMMKQYGGLASIAGVSLPDSGEASRAELGVQLIKSRAFIGDFVKRHDILPELMAVTGWDSVSGELIFDPEIYDPESSSWVRDVEPPRNAKPSLQEAHRAFLKVLGVSEDKQTGYVTISIAHQSPVVAAQWVSWLVSDVNAAVKAQDVEEAEKSIEYLTQQAGNTSLADLQAMFFELIQSQTETMMLAEVRPEYVFKTIDPAVVPENKSKPNRTLICLMGTLMGGALGCFVVLIRHYSRAVSEN